MSSRDLKPMLLKTTARAGATHGTHYLLKPRPFPASLSIVIPMYNEEEVMPALRAELTAFINELPTQVEVVLVNDGSSDRTIAQAAQWAQEDARIKVVQLSRNFGHQIAATAGLDQAIGEAVVLMDADLQDPVAVILQMVECYCEGYDVVYGQRTRRAGETAFKRLSAWAFYRLMQRFVYKSLPVDTGDFRLMSRGCLTALQQMRETHRFLRGMVTWVGFPQCSVVYERAPRLAGITKYPLRKMLSFAWTAATSFSIIPLKLSLFMGIAIGLLGTVEAAHALWAWAYGVVVPGWTSLMIVNCIIGSGILAGIAILGQYVGMIYEQAKGRPLYLVSQVFQAEQASRSQPRRHDRLQEEPRLACGAELDRCPAS